MSGPVTSVTIQPTDGLLTRVAKLWDVSSFRHAVRETSSMVQEFVAEAPVVAKPFVGALYTMISPWIVTMEWPLGYTVQKRSNPDGSRTIELYFDGIGF